MEINVYQHNNSLERPEAVQEIQVSQDPQEGQDSLDNGAFLGNQEDKEDQVISSE